MVGMVSRDWCCLNVRCRTAFHSFEPAPTCPECGNVRVHWIPGGGHIGKVAPKADRTLRQLADQYGFTNLNSPSPSRLDRAAPKADHPSPDMKQGEVNFGPGFTANIYGHPAYPRGKSSCEPSLTPPNIRGATVAVGDLASPMPRSRTVGGPSLNHRVMARHRP